MYTVYGNFSRSQSLRFWAFIYFKKGLRYIPGSAMLSLASIIYFASSLIVTSSAISAKHILTTSTPQSNISSTFLIQSLSRTLLTHNFTTTVPWRPICGLDSASPVTPPADCSQAVLNMFIEKPDHELLIWDGLRIWDQGSCGLYLLPAPGLPIHRDTFSRTDIAQCARSIRRACVNEEHGYRGRLLPVGAGVFHVAIAGRRIQLS